MQEIGDLLGLNASELIWYQMLLRAILVFILAMAFIRAAGMRSFGTHSAFDVVLNITIGAVLGRAVTGQCPFFSCLLAAFTLALCHRLTAILSYHFPRIRKLIEGDAVCLFSNDQKQKENLTKHAITESDLIRRLREENIDDYTNVKSIWYEADGKISIVKKMNN